MKSNHWKECGTLNKVLNKFWSTSDFFTGTKKKNGRVAKGMSGMKYSRSGIGQSFVLEASNCVPGPFKVQIPDFLIFGLLGQNFDPFHRHQSLCHSNL